MKWNYAGPHIISGFIEISIRAPEKTPGHGGNPHFLAPFSGNRTNWEVVAVTYGLNQQLVTWYTYESLIVKGVAAEVIGLKEKFFEPMSKNSSIF